MYTVNMFIATIININNSELRILLQMPRIGRQNATAMKRKPLKSGKRESNARRIQRIAAAVLSGNPPTIGVPHVEESQQARQEVAPHEAGQVEQAGLLVPPDDRPAIQPADSKPKLSAQTTETGRISRKASAQPTAEQNLSRLSDEPTVTARNELKLSSETTVRPRPPDSVFESWPFQPAPELEVWARRMLIDGDAPLQNPTHEHLQQATIGFLWAGKQAVRQMRQTIGQAKQGTFRGDPWSKAQQEQQCVQWFGYLPDFICTIDAQYALECSDREMLALLDHEFSHMAQAVNEFGAPKFTKDGMPVFAMKSHDVEEFVGIVERWGITSPALQRMVDAANTGPTIGDVQLRGACGTCGQDLQL